MRMSRSTEVRKPPIAKQLIVAAALCVSLLLGASSARAQSDTTTTLTNITIFSNLGPSTKNLYFTGTSSDDITGLCIVGAANPNRERCHQPETWLAMPFIPKQSSHATVLQVAIGLAEGTNQFELALFDDKNGTPGNQLSTVRVKDAPPLGTCCNLVTADLGTAGIALTAGTKYWVVAKSDDVNAPDFQGIWAFTNFSFVAGIQPTGLFGWGTTQLLGGLAFRVQGTTP